jgi:5-methylcytosine-specific restriction endonuclease McrA
MKRLNPKTGKFFRKGDVREDGFVFRAYHGRLQKDGFLKEDWFSPEKYIEYERRQSEIKLKRQLKRREFIEQYKINQGCCTCGYNKHPAALDFSHKNPKEKSFNISSGRFYSMKKLMEEIEKCNILCANCHREKTAVDKDYTHWRRVSAP